MLPPLIETFITSFVDAMIGVRRNKDIGSQTDALPVAQVNQGSDTYSVNIDNRLKLVAQMNRDKVLGALNRCLSTKEIEQHHSNAAKLSRMIDNTLSRMDKRAVNFVKMDPSMLPDSFRSLITSFKLNAKNLQRVTNAFSLAISYYVHI